MWRVKSQRNLKRAKGTGREWRRLAVPAGLAVFIGLGVFWVEQNFEWRRLGARLGRLLAAHLQVSLKEVQVSGNRRLPGSEIVTMSGLRPGMGMWDLSLGAIEDRLRRHPWLKSVVARREFPHRVVIEVKERIPKAVAALDKLYYVDAEGSVFQVLEKEGDSGEADLPIITGIGSHDWVSRSASLRERIHEVLQVSDLFGERSLPLSEIRFRSSKSVILYPVDFRVPLHMGWGEWSVKLDRLERVLSEWKGNELRLTGLDLSFRDQVVAKIRQSGG